MAKKSTLVYITMAILWEIAVGLIYGFFYLYPSAFQNIDQSSTTSTYNYSATTTKISTFKINDFAYPFTQAFIAIAIIVLIVGLAMVAGYIQRQSVTGMAFTLLIFALTIQNFFIFRTFWQYVTVNDPDASHGFNSGKFTKIGFINFANSLVSSFKFTSASLIDAVGASLAMYAGFTAVIGRIGLGQIFFLTWIGTFFYQMNSQILWRLWIPDNGYPSRALAYGATLGLVSSLILGKKNLTKNNINFKSQYRIMALAFLGIILVWCAYPILVLDTSGNKVNMAGQVNIWLALAASVLGSYTASAFAYRKFSVHDMVFSSITGAIAFSSSTYVNYNPGASTAIGFGVGLVCSFAQTKFKRKINENGVIDSNSVIFHFLVPSLFAAIFSAILTAIDQGSGTFNGSVISSNAYIKSGRSSVTQGGYQIAGWCISIGIGAVVGFMIGAVYKAINSLQQYNEYFDDSSLYHDERLSQKVVKPVERLHIGEKPIIRIQNDGNNHYVSPQ